MKIKPIPLVTDESFEPKGFNNFFTSLKYPIIFICSYRGSGKTTLIYNLIPRICYKTTRIYHVSSTVDKDPGNLGMVAQFEGKYDYRTFTSLSELDFDEIRAMDFNEPEKQTVKPLLFAKPRERVVRVTDQLLILDDIPDELANKELVKLCKTNRHYRLRLIISSQYLHDCKTDIRSQLDYLIIFRGITREKLELMHKMAKLVAPFAELWDMFNRLGRFGFLMIDIRNGIVRNDTQLQ